MKSISIGRDPECQLPIQDTEVSWKHCVLYERSDGRAELEDLGSTNGTFVNGQKKSSVTVPLYPGDVVQVGHAIVQWEQLLGREQGVQRGVSRETVRANPMEKPWTRPAGAPVSYRDGGGGRDAARDVHLHIDQKGRQGGVEKFETGAKGFLQIAKAAFYIALAILVFWLVFKVFHVFG